MLHEKLLDIEDIIGNIDDQKKAINGLRIIAYTCDSHLEAKYFAPMLLQIVTNMDKEITTLKSKVKELSK